MDPRPEFEPEERYSLPEQERILKLAARLQANHTGSATLSELEATAAEAGVDPACVREAVQRLKIGQKHEDPPLSTGLKILGAGFLFAQFYAVYGMLQDGWRSGFGVRGEHLWLAFGLTFVLGAALSSKRKAGWAGLAMIAGSTVAFSAMIGMFLRLAAGQTSDGWPRWIANFVAFEVILYGAGLLIGRVSAKFSKHLGPGTEADSASHP